MHFSPHVNLFSFGFFGVKIQIVNSKLLPWYTCDASVFGHVLTASKFVVQACDIQGNDLPELWSGLLRAPAGRRP